MSVPVSDHLTKEFGKSARRLGQLEKGSPGRRDQLLREIDSLAAAGVHSHVDGLPDLLAAWASRQANLAAEDGGSGQFHAEVMRRVADKINEFKEDPAARAAALPSHVGSDRPRRAGGSRDFSGMGSPWSVPSRTGTAGSRSANRPPRRSVTLAQVVDEFTGRLYLPDPGPVLFVLGVIQANRLPDGPPCWGVLVGPNSAGKSELLRPVGQLSNAVTIDVTSAAVLLANSRDADARGGVLSDLGEFGFLVMTDLGALLAQQRSTRGEVIAALSQVYDGSFARMGSYWIGRAGLLGAATEDIYRHGRALGDLGRRWLLFRMPDVSADAVARYAVEHLRDDDPRRSELAEVVRALVTDGERLPATGEHLALDDKSKDRLVILATFIATARTPIERDATHQVDTIGQPETPSRASKQLAQLFRGLISLDVPPAWAWRVVAQTAMSSAPGLRRDVLRELHRRPGGVGVSELATTLRQPETTVRRVVDDLNHLRLVSTRTGPVVLSQSAARPLAIIHALLNGADPDTGELLDTGKLPGLPLAPDDTTGPEDTR